MLVLRNTNKGLYPNCQIGVGQGARAGVPEALRKILYFGPKSGLECWQSQGVILAKNALARVHDTYGASAPEAGAIISPFISGVEREAPFLASQHQYNLMRLERGSMLNDRRTADSTFIKRYSTAGILQCLYSNDQRVSHAHGGSTGPTSMLGFYVAGVYLRAAGGAVWHIALQLGDFTSVASGFLGVPRYLGLTGH